MTAGVDTLRKEDAAVHSLVLGAARARRISHRECFTDEAMPAIGALELARSPDTLMTHQRDSFGVAGNAIHTVCFRGRPQNLVYPASNSVFFAIQYLLTYSELLLLAYTIIRVYGYTSS